MLRKIVDYKKLDHELAALLIESYPDGYGDDDIIVFKNLQGETVEAVEIRTKDTQYLVKISKSLAEFISNFEDTIEKELEGRPDEDLEDEDVTEFELETDLEFDSDDDLD
ncbi:hypothetical protein LCGC14_1175180 [marine sediment metagenome]|uniref:DNA primase n=2 Tax=root TaxID=1 RepID=A0A831QUJ4_9FLAO|nr:hypothetical protein [Pricia sp.]HEA23441.1 hypothetical protein [Pricia antarctica]